MVEVDVFWSYALGAGLALSATRQLRARQVAVEPQSAVRAGAPPVTAGRARSLLTSPHYVATIVFLALIFAPSGLYLVWQFPSWETMHLGDHTMPAWLVTGFAITNVTQGMLAFWVVERLVAHGRTYLAYLQTVVAYVAFFFILVHGWDGTGYQRFFSPTAQDFRAWHGDWTAFLTSDVAMTLLVMGVILIPSVFWLMGIWITEGYRIAGDALGGGRAPNVVVLAMLAAATIFGVGLGLALADSLIIRGVGAWIGVPAAVVLDVAAMLPGGPVERLWRRFRLDDAPAATGKKAAPRRRPAAISA